MEGRVPEASWIREDISRVFEGKSIGNWRNLNKENLSFKAVEEVLWVEEVGAWLDYDTINDKPRDYFVPTNLSPLWMRCYNPDKRQHIADRVIDYINRTRIDDYPGGVPTTLVDSGEQWVWRDCLSNTINWGFTWTEEKTQWGNPEISFFFTKNVLLYLKDWPNVWAPLQHILVVGLDNLDDVRTKRIAQDWAQRWVQGNYRAFEETGAMYEKVCESLSENSGMII